MESQDRLNRYREYTGYTMGQWLYARREAELWAKRKVKARRRMVQREHIGMDMKTIQVSD